MNLFRMLLCVSYILLESYRTTAENPRSYVRPVCSSTLRWVPLLTKTAFISFMNDPYCPSWTTRHIITKLKQHGHIEVPRGLPFAFVVGVCYRPTSDVYNFSVTVKKNFEEFEEVLEPEDISDRNGRTEHNFRRHECLVRKFLTKNLTSPGRFTCTANFGSATVIDFVNYVVTDVPVVKQLIALSMSNSLDKVALACPSLPLPESEDNPVVHVWFGPGVMQGQENVTMSSSAVFHVPQKTDLFKVSCASYNIIHNLYARVVDFHFRRESSFPFEDDFGHLEGVREIMGEYVVPNSPTGESFEAYERTEGCINVAITPLASQIVDYSKRPYSGSHVDVFRIIMEHLGWCYYFVRAPGNAVGVPVNGSFTGATGMIERKEADMIMGPVALVVLRSSALNYGYGYIWGDCLLLYRRITTTQPDVFTLIKPFHVQVWFTILASLAFVGVAATGFNTYHRVLSQDSVSDRSKERSEHPGLVFRSVMWTWKILVSQDLSDSPRGRPGHILTIFWLVISFMIASMYRCNLKAILINDKVKIPFRNAAEFVSQNEYRLTWINGKIFGEFLEDVSIRTPDEPLGKMWAKRADPILPDEILATVMGRKIAVLEPTLAVKSFIADDFSKYGDCRLAVADSDVTPAYMSFAFPLESPLREHIDSVLLRLFQAGIPQQLQNYNMRNASWCLRPSSASVSRPIAIQDLFGIFLIHFIGLGLGTLIFLLELTVHSSSSKSRATATNFKAPPLPRAGLLE